MNRLRLLAVLFVSLALLVACAAPPAATTDTGSEAAATEAPAEAATEAEAAPAESGAFECTDAIGCVEVAAGDPIRLAYMLSVSGATATLGEDARGGIEIAISDKGQVLGHDVELVGEDTLCNAEGGQTAGTKVAADSQVVAVVGTTCSSEAVAALPIISEAGLTMVSPSNTSPRLTEPDPAKDGVWQPGYFRTAINDLIQGKVAADFVFNELSATKLATIHDGSPYAESLQQVAADRFRELGGEVTFQGAVNVGDTDMRPILTEIAANPPDVLYFPIFQPEGNLVAAQAREIPGLENTVFMASDGLFADDFPENTGETSVGMYLSGPYVAGTEAYEEFLAKWADQIGGVPPSVYHAHAYDATNMIFDAIEQVAQQSDDGTLLIGRQALRDALAATKDFPGVTGVLTCGETGDCGSPTALAISQLGEDELNGNWPPPVVWQPAVE